MMTVKEFAQKYNLIYCTHELLNTYRRPWATIESSYIPGKQVKKDLYEYLAAITEDLSPDGRVIGLRYRSARNPNCLSDINHIPFNPEDDAQAQEAISAIFDEPYPFRPAQFTRGIK